MRRTYMICDFCLKKIKRWSSNYQQVHACNNAACRIAFKTFVDEHQEVDRTNQELRGPLDEWAEVQYMKTRTEINAKMGQLEFTPSPMTPAQDQDLTDWLDDQERDSLRIANRENLIEASESPA